MKLNHVALWVDDIESVRLFYMTLIPQHYSLTLFISA